MHLKKNSSTFLILTVFFVLAGCNTKPEDNFSPLGIPLNPTEAQKANLSEVFPDFEAINITVPDSVFFGNIEQIKSDDKRIYLLDPFQSKSIIILDKKGNFINQLKKIGRGPGEYVSPYAFTVNTSEDELILYDRGKLEFLRYKLPTLEFLGSTRKNALLMNFERLDGGDILAVRDDSKNKSELFGLEIWNKEFETLKDGISDMQNAVIELSYHSTIGKKNKDLLYAHPFNGLIHEVSNGGLVPIYDLAFNDWEVPEELYSMEEANDFEEALTRDKYVLWPRFPLESQNSLKFWYMYGADIDSYHFLIHDTQTSKQLHYSEIVFDGTSIKTPIPLGIVDDFYVSLILPENIDPEDIPVDYQETFQKSLSTELPILIYLK